VILLLLIGLFAGCLSGLLGIGGGLVIVPALIMFAGLTQHQAQGTSLALLLLPIGLAGAWAYYQQGLIDFKLIGPIALGFTVGAFLGAQYAVHLPVEVLKRAFGILLIVVGFKFLLK
jgi:uncharacterized protein